MLDELQDFFVTYTDPFKPRLYLFDGFNLSVQANKYCYCLPKKDGLSYYAEVEIGYPSHADNSLNKYIEDCENPIDTIYPYVLTEILEEIIIKHGGIDFKKTQEEFLERERKQKDFENGIL